MFNKKYFLYFQINFLKNPYPLNFNSIFKLRKKSDHIPKSSRVLADSGYKGLQNIHKRTKIPIKKPKNKGLDNSSKLYNKILSKKRVYVEHKIGELKRFNILGQKYRNEKKKYGIKMNIISGLVNMKNGF